MQKFTHEKIWIAFVATCPPRECGIATFTADLVEHFDDLFVPREETKIVAMNRATLATYKYPKKVILEISENNKEDYINAARKLNDTPEIKLVCIQHEFGIFGGGFGKNLLFFLEELKKPVAVVFHMVLPNPPEGMKAIMAEIVARAHSLIVMTEMSRQLLLSVYGAPAAKIKLIPHGIHPMAYTDGKIAKLRLGLSGKRVLSTFGLLGRGKGIEYAISALPEIIKKYPNTVYLVVGATHPVVVEKEGEVYRNELIERARSLGVADHVIFYNKYFETPELLKFLEATDIYLSLSQNPDQAVSGTLTYALGAGRPVLSTPFMQAKEVITPELGRLVEFGDSASISSQVISLFGDEETLLKIGKAAYFRTRGMIWPNVALSYMRAFLEISPELAQKERSLPPLKFDHVLKLTDEFGMFQFAKLDVPDPAWGYTLDDNARALITVSWYYDIDPDPQTRTILGKLALVYIGFLEYVFRKEGGFENYVNHDRSFHVERNTTESLEDANARALWALAVAVSGNLPHAIKERARKLLDQEWMYSKKVKSPRAMAFVIKALAILPESDRKAEERKKMIEYADILVDFYKGNAGEDWNWFEDVLTYSNALLPEALLLAYKETGDPTYLRIGKSTLDFLIAQSFEGKVCVPVGQAGWYRRGGKKHLYDQQPEEVAALVSALFIAHKVTGEKEYLERMDQAFHWFLGNNLLHQVVYSHMTGGCYDGVGEKEINLNQGAESTISYLMARIIMEGV